VVAGLLRDRSFELVTSPRILLELRASLRYPRVRRRLSASEDDLDLWVEALRLVADVVPDLLRVRAVLADPDDDKYVAAAVEGVAGLLVTGDSHLLSLGAYEGIRIVTPRTFLDLLDR
jgi:putative PIN family toxin of toxin-antitoxin system